MNTFGEKFCFTSFGESHGRAIGGVLDGVPAGIKIDMDLIRRELTRRKGQTPSDSPSKGEDLMVSERAKREADEVEWLSGVVNENANENENELITLGTPIAFLIRNTDARPEDYEYLRHHFRPGHADRTYQQKYGIRDWRGGGRASARETAARVVAGCVARQQLAEQGIQIHAELIQVGEETRPEQFADYINAIRREGDSIGGIVRCTISGLPIGTGEPIFDKLQSHLAFAIMSINACRGFDFGTGFEGIGMRGSEANRISGGILGGISDGTDITFRCIFKPTPSISKEQAPLALSDSDLGKGAGGKGLQIKGRHDPCVAIRAVPVVEAMTALCLINIVGEH